MDRIVTTGTFDGVHAGHRMLLGEMRRVAEARSLSPLVLVLSPHPLSVVAPERAPGLLSSPEERIEMIRCVYPEADVRILNFNQELRGLTHRQFMEMLRDEYGAKVLFVGHDNRFGKDIDTPASQYAVSASESGLDLQFCHALPGVSSSAVRKALLAGAVGEGAEMLRRPYSVSGVVGHGRQLGRTLGFPTANVTVEDPQRLIPAPGVYAGYARVGDLYRKAIINIGVRPTVDLSPDARTSIEAYLLNFNEDLYGKRLTLYFCHRLREEIRFSSVEELADRLRLDAAEASAILPAPEEYAFLKK